MSATWWTRGPECPRAVQRWQMPQHARYALRTQPGVAPTKRAEIRAFMAWYRRHYPARHFIPVEVYNSGSITVPGTTQRVHGLYWYPHRPRAHPLGPKVYVAGNGRSTWSVLHTLAHELSHYEEWRQRGMSTERGKNQKATRLMRDYELARGGRVR